MKYFEPKVSRKEVFVRRLDTVQLMIQVAAWVAGIFAGFAAGVVLGICCAIPGLIGVGIMRAIGYRVRLHWEVSKCR